MRFKRKFQTKIKPLGSANTMYVMTEFGGAEQDLTAHRAVKVRFTVYSYKRVSYSECA